MEQTKKKKWFSAIFFALLLLATAFVLWHWRQELYALITSQQARDEFVAFVRSTGWRGLLAFLGLQMLQVLVAVIPGEPVEIMAGALYGTLGGMIICLVGVLIGSVLIYCFMHFLGANPLEGEKFQKYRFLQEPRRVETLVFLLFLVPGTPKDILLYLAPFLPMRPKRFFMLSTLARIPSVVSSTFAGATLARGQFGLMIAVFLVTGAAGLVGILCHDRLIKMLSEKKQQVQHHREQKKEK